MWSMGAKYALQKAGIPDLSTLSMPTASSLGIPIPGFASSTASKTAAGGPVDPAAIAAWPAWISRKSLPMSVQPWLSAPPPPMPVAAQCPRVGEAAPQDPQGLVLLGGGRKFLVVFLRCVGCAFAQKTFIALRTLANRHPSALTCVAVSHASPEATQRWLDMLGGAWNVDIVMDPGRSVYAAWGLGDAPFWHLLNPTTQVQSWLEPGWLGDKLAGALQRTATQPPSAAGVVDTSGDNPALGSKWQTAGAFAIDGAGRVVWGTKAERADDVMDLDAAVKALRL